MSKYYRENKTLAQNKKLTLDLSEKLASQLFKFARDAGAPPEVLAEAILISHVEKDSLDESDLRDS
jgi:hypothetical protein